MQKTLIVIGILFLVIGLFYPVIDKLPFGRLPGDLIIERPGFKLYIPITSLLIISVLISLILWLFRR